MDGGYQPDHGGFDGGRRGKPRIRYHTDIGVTLVRWGQNRKPRYKGSRGFERERPHPSYIVDMLPPAARRSRAVDTIPAKHLHSSLNKVKHPVNVVKWTPNGRRLLTGSTSGEFTLWNGTSFNFETIMQAHDSALRTLTYSHNDDWLLSADQDGIVKYWQPNFNNVKQIQAHGDVVRDLAFAPTDVKFVTASDDATLKIFDFATSQEDYALTGHQWDAKSVDWHPTKGLIVSGSKDHTVKLWDPRSGGRCLTTLHGHKNTIARTKFQPGTAVLLATCARDNVARIFDIRMMRDVVLLKGHDKDICSLVWHPIHDDMISTGSADGAMHHYLLNEQNPPQGPKTLSVYDAPDKVGHPAQSIWPAHKVTYAHEFNIWSMDWHPLGHILASGANDKVTRFWTRNRPGDRAYLTDRFHIGQAAAEAQGTWKRSEAARAREEEEAEMDDEADALPDQRTQGGQSYLPGLPGLPGIGAMQPTNPNNTAQSAGMAMPNFGSGPPPMLPPGMDLEKIKEMFGGKLPPQPGQPGFPTSLQGMPAPPPGFVPPPGFPSFSMPPVPMPMQDSAESTGHRRRGPLPSQQESLQAEMRQGRYTKPR